MIKCERFKTNPQRCNKRQRQTFCDMVNVYVFDIRSICIHGKELLRQFAFHQKYRTSHTSKQMFDISENLITEQSDEIYGVNTIYWGDSGNIYLWLVVKKSHQSPANSKVYVFSDSVLCFGKMNEKPHSNYAWEDRLTWFKSSSEYRTLDRIDGEPMESEWTIFPGFTTLQLCHKIQELLS